MGDGEEAGGPAGRGGNVRQLLSKSALLTTSTFTHILNTQETRLESRMGERHELTRALQRTPLCFSTKSLARGHKSEHTLEDKRCESHKLRG